MNRNASKTGPAKDFWSWDWLWKRLLDPWRIFIVGTILCACGFIFACLAHQMIDRGERSLHWPAAEGTVVRSTIVPVVERNRHGRETRKYMAACIECIYKAKGRNLKYSWQESENIFAVLEKYPVGGRVKIFYDPEFEDAILHPGVRDANRSMWRWSTLAAALGAAFMVFSLRKIWRLPAA